MNITAEEVQTLYQDRKQMGSPEFARWAEIAELANGNMRVPTPELDKNERATVVNLFPGGLDGLATRAASVPPDQAWPPLRDGIDLSENKARDRRLIGRNWWEQNNMTLVDYLRFRDHFGFGCMPVKVSPVSTNPRDTRQMPHWLALDPRETFPAPRTNKLDMCPSDTIIATRMRRHVLEQKYPVAMSQVAAGPPDQRRRDDVFEVLEYIDCDEIVLVCCGMATPGPGIWTPKGEVRGAAAVVLERDINKSGVPLVIYPKRITLDHCQGALDQMIPAYRQSAILDSYNKIAIARGIFQNEWVQGHPNSPADPEIIVRANGITGQIGEIRNGVIQTIGPSVAAAQLVNMAIDRDERAQRVVAGLPSELSGESGSNIRTARRGDQVLGSAIDMPIQEAQEIMAVSKKYELQYGVAVMKGWYGNKTISFYVSERNQRLERTYEPKETFETDEVTVSYSMPGVDSAGVPIELGQRVNMGTLSIEGAQERDPLIIDPTMERIRIQQEGLTRALLASLEQGVQQGTIGPDEIAAITEASFESKDQLYKVVQRVHQDMQAKQAAQQQTPPGAPSNMPGLGPAAGVGSSGPPPNPGLAQILSSLRSPAQQGQAEQQAGQPQPQQPAMAG